MTLVDDTSRSDALAVLRGLIDLLAQPQAARKLIDELAAAQEKTNEAQRAIKQLAVETEKSRAAMAAELDAHRRRLSDERQVLNAEINQRRNEVAKAEAAMTAAKERAETDARQADALRADWQRKCDAVGAALRA
jgi:hypothetical protein